MHLEIERKFLVMPKKLPASLAAYNPTLYIQGYLSERPAVRVRLIGPDEAKITIKTSGMLSRQEFEYPIPREDGELLIKLCGANVLQKTHYKIPHKGYIWDVDQFHDKLDGLWLAEIELSYEDEVFESPPWAITEVTDVPGFSNVSLAVHGKPKL